MAHLTGFLTPADLDFSVPNFNPCTLDSCGRLGGNQQMGVLSLSCALSLPASLKYGIKNCSRLLLCGLFDYLRLVKLRVCLLCFMNLSPCY